MLSDEKKCIFVHIPKTGGTSMSVALGFSKSSRRDHRTIRQIMPLSVCSHFRLLGMPPNNVYSRRDMLLSMIRSNKTRRLSKYKFDSYLKFTIVRNPWGRVFSWYKNCMRDKRHGIPECSFHDFVQNHISENWALKPQLDWIIDFSGKVAVDRLLRFENLQYDTESLFKDLGLGIAKLPHELDSGAPPADYRFAYDTETKRTVAQKYEEEIDLFKYRFI